MAEENSWRFRVAALMAYGSWLMGRGDSGESAIFQTGGYRRYAPPGLKTGGPQIMSFRRDGCHMMPCNGAYGDATSRGKNMAQV